MLLLRFLCYVSPCVIETSGHRERVLTLALDDEKVVKDSFSEHGDAAGENEGAIDEEDALFCSQLSNRYTPHKRSLLSQVLQLDQQMAPRP